MTTKTYSPTADVDSQPFNLQRAMTEKPGNVHQVVRSGSNPAIRVPHPGHLDPVPA